MRDTVIARSLAESDRLRAKHPGRVPVLISVDQKSDVCLSKTKYLVPGDMQFGMFVASVRRRDCIDSSKSLIFFLENRLVPASALLSEIWHSAEKPDGFLRLVVSQESTFG